MENFKIEFFYKENNNKSFPHFEKLLKPDCDLIKFFLYKKFNQNELEKDTIKVLKLIRENSLLMPNINAELYDFDFEKLVNKLQVSKTGYININWNKFENIDRFKLKDFSDNFKYIWYAGPDDIEIFPDDISWIISIDAMGCIYLFVSS